MRSALVVVALFALAGAGRAQSPPADEAEFALPQAHAFLDSTSTHVGARLSLTLEIEEPPGWKVAPPDEKLDLEPFRLRAVERIPRPDGQAYRLTIVPLQSGDTEIPEITLAARGPEGRSEEVTTEPIPVTVASHLPPPPSDEARPAPVEAAAYKAALTAPRKWMPVIVAVLVGLLLAALAIYLVRRFRGREVVEALAPRERRPLRPAWEIALEALDRIQAANYVGQGQLGRQYVEVTEALRTYLENRYGVPALESTTTDLTEHLHHSPVSRDLASRILSLLREADLVKFAKASPDPTEARSTEARARSLVVATIPANPSPESGA